MRHDSVYRVCHHSVYFASRILSCPQTLRIANRPVVSGFDRPHAGAMDPSKKTITSLSLITQNFLPLHPKPLVRTYPRNRSTRRLKTEPIL